MNDLVGDQAKKYSLVESKIISLVNSYGFDEVRTPLAEVTELFERSIGSSTDIVNKELYSFEDRNNKSISIRPEGTAGVVRALIENDLDRHGIDVWYLGPMYRYERPQKGRLRQFQQFGVESLIDQEKSSQEELIRMELKVIGCLLDIVEVLNIKDFKLEINNIGSSETKKKYSKELVSFLETNLDKLSDTEKNRLSTNPLRILDSKDPITRDILKSAPEYTDFLSKDEKQHLSKLTNAIEENYIKPHIQQNLVRGLDYYSGIVFEVVCNDLGAQNAIAGGGFYSELFEEFGGSTQITSALFGYGSFDQVSVDNSAKALFYFSFGLPAFSLIKIFSTFLFARNDTKTPFKFSLISVILNIIISLVFFSQIGFIIIPIATTISSWFNGIILLIFVINKNYFKFSSSFLIQITKIIFSNIISILIFYFLINFLSSSLDYANNYKFIFIIFIILLTFFSYIGVSLLIKAFKITDINLKY